MKLAKSIYLVTATLPKTEMYGLISQMRRAVTSIPSNIAEGSKRGKKEFHQYLRVANASAGELETQLLLSRDIFGIDIVDVHSELLEIQKMLEAFIKKVAQ